MTIEEMKIEIDRLTEEHEIIGDKYAESLDAAYTRIDLMQRQNDRATQMVAAIYEAINYLSDNTSVLKLSRDDLLDMLYDATQSVAVTARHPFLIVGQDLEWKGERS